MVTIPIVQIKIFDKCRNETMSLVSGRYGDVVNTMLTCSIRGSPRGVCALMALKRARQTLVKAIQKLSQQWCALGGTESGTANTSSIRFSRSRICIQHSDQSALATIGHGQFQAVHFEVRGQRPDRHAKLGNQF